MLTKREKKPLYGYAPGGYTAKCDGCGEAFVGDKRATECFYCAVDRHESAMRLVVENLPGRTEFVCEPPNQTGFKMVCSEDTAQSLKAAGWTVRKFRLVPVEGE